VGRRPFNECDVYYLLLNIAVQQREYEQGEAYAQELEKVASSTRMIHLVAEAVMAQSLFKLKFNRPEEANARYARAWALLENYTVPLSVSFYDFACAHQESLLNTDAALKLREKQLADLLAVPNAQFEAYCRLQRCRLLGRMGQPIEDELRAAYASCNKLKTPTLSLERVQKVEQGDYTDPYLICSPTPDNKF
jgi:hypothetical protein